MGRPTKYSEAFVYVVYVLWMIGHSQETIARVLRLRKKQVAGIIDQSDYRNRSAMTGAKRQEYLDELKAIRVGADGVKIDQGLLDRVDFQVIALGGRQKTNINRGRRA